MLIGVGHTPMSGNLTRVTTKNSPLHFARFEFKYILSAEKRALVENDLRYFLQYDPFVEDQPDQKYFVRSLYFDDPGYSAFHDKVDGLHSRSKFRLRTYGAKQTDDAPLYLEIKGRHNNLVFKHRMLVTKSGVDWGSLEKDAVAAAILSQSEECSVKEQFKYELLRKHLKPVALIDYMRRPYLSKYDPTFRITFDENITAIETGCMFPGYKSQPKLVVPGATVLEVKFHHHMPLWFHRVIQTHELRRVSISKICAGMESLGLAFDEN